MINAKLLAGFLILSTASPAESHSIEREASIPQLGALRGSGHISAPVDWLTSGNSEVQADSTQDCPSDRCDSINPMSSPMAVAAIASTGINGARGLTGEIIGTVTDSSTKLPVLNLTVEAFNDQGDFFDAAATGSDGTYRITGLVDGDYVIRAGTSSPYFIELYQDLRCPGTGSSCDYANGTPVTVISGDATGGIDFTLDPAGLIAGTVTDSGTGLGVPSMLLEVFDSQGSSAGFGFTSSDGQYEAPRLASGDYFIKTSSSFYQNELYQDFPCADECDATTGTLVSVTEGSTTPDINFALDPGGVISGTITDSETGLGIPGGFVDVYDDQGFYISAGFPDSEGVYRVSNLGIGDYFVRTSNASSSGYLDELYEDLPCAFSCVVTSGTPVSVSIAEPSAVADFELDLGGEITGNMIDSASTLPLPDARVSAFNSQGASVRSGSADISGDYRIRGLVTGDYFVRAGSFTHLDELYEGISCVDSSCIVTDGTAVPVTTGDTTAGIDFTLDPGGEITGKVTNGDGTMPLFDVTVQAVNGQGDFQGSGFTDSSGDYRISGLATGDYFLRVFSPEYVDELYQDIPCLGPSCIVSAGTAVPATAGDTTKGIDFALMLGGEITGTVTESASGEPLEQTIVDVYDDQGNRIHSSFSDADGIYRLAGLLTGDYFVAAEPDAVLGSPLGRQLYMGILCSRGCDVTTGTPVSVTLPDITIGIDFALQPSEYIFIGDFE